MTDESQPPPTAPKAAAFFMLVPLFSVILVMGAYASLFVAGLIGGSANGPRMQFSYEGCPEAQPVMAKRVERMGLGDPQWSTNTTSLVLTASLPIEAPEGLAEVLARPGRLQVFQDGQSEALFTNEHITDSSPRYDLLMIPYTVISLNEPSWKKARETSGTNVQGRWRFEIDGEIMGYQSNVQKITTPEFEVSPSGEDDQDRLQKAVDWSLVLHSGPLPCDVRLLSEQPIP